MSEVIWLLSVWLGFDLKSIFFIVLAVEIYKHEQPCSTNKGLVF